MWLAGLLMQIRLCLGCLELYTVYMKLYNALFFDKGNCSINNFGIKSECSGFFHCFDQSATFLLNGFSIVLRNVSILIGCGIFKIFFPLPYQVSVFATHKSRYNWLRFSNCRLSHSVNGMKSDLSDIYFQIVL